MASHASTILAIVLLNTVNALVLKDGNTTVSAVVSQVIADLPAVAINLAETVEDADAPPTRARAEILQKLTELKKRPTTGPEGKETLKQLAELLAELQASVGPAAASGNAASLAVAKAQQAGVASDIEKLKQLGQLTAAQGGKGPAARGPSAPGGGAGLEKLKQLGKLMAAKGGKGSTPGTFPAPGGVAGADKLKQLGQLIAAAEQGNPQAIEGLKQLGQLTKSAR